MTNRIFSLNIGIYQDFGTCRTVGICGQKNPQLYKPTVTKKNGIKLYIVKKRQKKNRILAYVNFFSMNLWYMVNKKLQKFLDLILSSR